MEHTKGEWKATYHRVVIEHPEWSDDGKVVAICNEWLPEAKANAHLIVAAVNACAKVNPDNPQAVAESISDLYEALRLLLRTTKGDGKRKHHNLCYGLDIEAHPDCELCKLISVERVAGKAIAKADNKAKVEGG